MALRTQAARFYGLGQLRVERAPGLLGGVDPAVVPGTLTVLLQVFDAPNATGEAKARHAKQTLEQVLARLSRRDADAMLDGLMAVSDDARVNALVLDVRGDRKARRTRNLLGAGLAVSTTALAVLVTLHVNDKF